ncbi:MAG: DNA primase [Candidatus Paceibacterota bacterium]|jgi:DNA primase
MASSVEQIKERLNIEEVVGSYIKLERAGNSLKAKCPFHNEKTPSFFVSPERGSYYCFGCGAKGDIFTFVQEFEGIDFLGSLKILADKAGVTLEHFSSKLTDKKERLYQLLEVATFFLQRNLESEEIPLNYLKKRGLNDETIKNWKIGYVRDEWRSISDYLKSKSFTDEEIERAGISKTEGKNTYDRFRGRIMFPIFDSAGRVIAYSGRILHDDGQSAKYLNSPQTELFDKSKVLYGFDRAKQSIRKFDFSILVEGQMDLLMAHQAGFTNTVASSGTALTPEHLALLKRISNKIIMSFDSDNAGAKAAERGWALALSCGMDVKIAEIPKGFDPADLILKDKEQFKNVLKNSIFLIDFLLNRAQSEIQDKKKLWENIKTKILPYVYLLDGNTERSRYVKKISDMIDIKEDFIWDDLKKVKLDEEFQSQNQTENKTIDKEISQEILKKGSVERSLAGIITKQESGKMNTSHIREKIKKIIGEEKYQKFEEEYKNQINELAFEAEGYYANIDENKLHKETDYLILALREEYFKKELEKLLTNLKKAEKEKTEDAISSISIRLKEIMQKLSEIKNEKHNFYKK